MAKRRVKLFILAGIFTILLIAFFTILQSVSDIPKRLPEVTEISAMKATYYDGEEHQKIQFWVPKDRWDNIFDALLPAELDTDPAAWQVLGQLDIALNNGHPFVVMLFSLREGMGAFASGDTIERRVYYRGGDSIKLKEALRAAFKASQRE